MFGAQLAWSNLRPGLTIIWKVEVGYKFSSIFYRSACLLHAVGTSQQDASTQVCRYRPGWAKLLCLSAVSDPKSGVAFFLVKRGTVSVSIFVNIDVCAEMILPLRPKTPRSDILQNGRAFHLDVSVSQPSTRISTSDVEECADHIGRSDVETLAMSSLNLRWR